MWTRVCCGSSAERALYKNARRRYGHLFILAMKLLHVPEQSMETATIFCTGVCVFGDVTIEGSHCEYGITRCFVGHGIPSGEFAASLFGVELLCTKPADEQQKSL